MCDRGADVVKIAVTPALDRRRGPAAGLRARAADAGGGPPLVAIAMGPLGVVTRIAGRPLRRALHLRLRRRGRGVGARPDPGRAHGRPLPRARRHPRPRASTAILGSDVGAQPLARPAQPRLRGARRSTPCTCRCRRRPSTPFLTALPALDLSGFSVTRPYKVEILPHLHEVEEAAAVCGSVNTVVVAADGTLRGSTTDGIGVLAPAEEARRREGASGGDPGRGRRGALGRAVPAPARARAVTLLARDPEQAAAAARGGGLRARARSPTLRRYPWDVLINATPVGSGALVDETPLPADAAPPGHGRARHGLRPAGDALPARGAGRGLHDRRRPGDAARAGGGAVRDLDGAGGAGGRHAAGRGLPGPGAGASERGRDGTRGRSCSRASAPRGRQRIRAAARGGGGLRRAGLRRSPR